MALNISGGGLEFQAGLDTTDFNAKIDQVTKRIDNVGKNVGKGLFNEVAKGAAQLFAVEKVISFVGDSISEALDAEAAAARLTNTLENISRLDAFDRIAGKAEDMAKRFQYLDNDDIIGVYQRLITYGKLTQKQMDELLPVIVDFSAKQRISIEQGSGVIIKALSGNAKGLKEYGINIKDVTTDAGRLNEVMTTLKQKVDGAGDAFQKTASGGMAQARQEMANIQEEIGGKLMPAIKSLLGFLNTALDGVVAFFGTYRDKANEAIDDIVYNIKKYATISKQIFSGDFTGAALTFADPNKKLLDQQKKDNAALQKSQEDALKFAKAYNGKSLKEQQAALKGQVALRDASLKAYKESVAVGNKGTEESKRLALQLVQDNEIVTALEKEIAATKDNRVLGSGGGETPESVKKDNSAANALLNERKNILEKIRDIQKQSFQSGLSDDQLELARVNEGYVELLRLVKEYNEKAKKSGSKSFIDTSEIEEAQRVELRNTSLKKEAALYIENLAVQKSAFVQFEEAKLQIGEAKAKQLFKAQTAEADSYLQLLEQEAGKLITKKEVFKIKLNPGEENKLKALLDEIKTTRGKISEDETQAMVDLISSTISYGQKRDSINKRYAQDYKTLSDNLVGLTEDEQDRILKIKQAAQAKELQDLDNAAIRQSELYQKLGTDLIGFSKEKIKGLITELEKELSSGTFTDLFGNVLAISPEFKKQLEDYIEQLKAAVNLNKSLKTASIFETVGTGLSQLASEIGSVNSALSNTIGALGNISGSVSGAIKSLNLFNNSQKTKDKEADILGQISGGLGIVGAATSIFTTVISVFEKAKQKQREMRKAQKDGEVATFSAELEINALYRQRELSQIRTNELKLEGIRKEKAALIAQQASIEKEFAETFAELRKVASASGFLDYSTTTFEEFEKIFAGSGINDRSKQLFELLQKLKKEGADVTAALAALEDETKKALTGTTADALVDSIAEGFAGGLRSAKDFASKTEDIIRNALLSAFKYQTLQEPLKKLYEELALNAKDGLDSAEIAKFTTDINKTITDAAKIAAEIEKATGVKLSSATAGGTSLTGAIKGITEGQADLLAGQFGGLRITSIESLNVARAALRVHENIQINTSLTAARLSTMIDKMDYYYNAVGVKIKP